MVIKHSQTATQGHPWQQGGTFVVGPGGLCHYIHRDETAGDHPDLTELLESLNNLPTIVKSQSETSTTNSSTENSKL